MSMPDFHINEHSDLEEPYKAFVTQMSNWYNGGELPELAGQDLRFALELQRQKLQSLGLDMQCNLNNTGSMQNNVGGISFSDRIFTNSIVGGNINMTRSIGGDRNSIYENTTDIGLSTIIQSLKTDTRPSASMALCCPHCGAPSTLGELEAGCKYCGTKFLMSELYPKVMNFFISENVDKTKNDAKNKRELKKYLTVSIIPMVVFGIISNLFAHQSQSMIFNIIWGIIGGILAGGMIGGLIFGFKKLFETLALMGNSLRGGGKIASTLYYANKIKKNDPEFSSEYFRDKITSLFRMAVYSKDASELACCKCRCPEKGADIIEAQLYNFSITDCAIKDMVCDVEVILYLDCLHYINGKIKSKTDKFRMRVRKHLKNLTELGFSFAAVSCPSCGSSFDARNVKACPYCNNEYLHEEHDWVITDIR